MNCRKLRSVIVAATSVALLGGLGFATPAAAAQTINNEFGTFDFQESNREDIVGDGTDSGDKVLFRNVRTVGGVAMDALVSTTGDTNATINNLSADGSPGAIDVHTTITSPSGGSASFSFAFYRSGTYGAPNEDQITLQNVQLTIDDIDLGQYARITDIDGFTLSSPSRIEPPTPAPVYPQAVTFQGSSENGNNDPRDQVVVTYGEVTTPAATLGSGNDGASAFRVTLGPLGFGNRQTVTDSTSVTLDYDANGGGGVVPASTTGRLGSITTLASGSDLTPPAGLPDATFEGWSTTQDGSGTLYEAEGAYTMPYQGAVLYASWSQPPGPPITPTTPPSGIAPPKKVKKSSVSGSATSKRYTVRWKAPRQTAQRPVAGYRLTVQMQRRSRVILLKDLGTSPTKYTLTRKALMNAVQSLQTRGDITGGYAFIVKVRATNDAGAGGVGKSRLTMAR